MAKRDAASPGTAFHAPLYLVDKNGEIQTVIADGADGAALLQAGTDETPRAFSAKEIHDEIARQVGS